MKELRSVIAKNIQSLRIENRLTQLELAQILNYSDKAISKWERAEAIPDITVLKQLADHFGVTVDYLLEEEHSTTFSERRLRKLLNRNRMIIALVSIIGVFAIATVIFSMLFIMNISAPWLVFVFAVPISGIVALVLNCVWGKKQYTFVIISVLIWSLLASAYLSLLMYLNLNWWAIFFIGVPSQAILLVLSGMKSVMRRKEKRADVQSTESTAEDSEAI